MRTPPTPISLNQAIWPSRTIYFPAASLHESKPSKKPTEAVLVMLPLRSNLLREKLTKDGLKVRLAACPDHSIGV